MDSRRASRTVIDPMVRTVGFNAPGAPPPQQPQQSIQSVIAESVSGPLSSSPPSIADISPVRNYLSPVMIPPPIHSSVPLPVPVPTQMSPLGTCDSGAGSYNPSGSIMENLSPRSRVDMSEFADGASLLSLLGKSSRGILEKTASSLPVSNGELMEAAKVGGRSLRATNNPSTMGSLTKVSAVNMPAGNDAKRVFSPFFQLIVVFNLWPYSITFFYFHNSMIG